MKKFIYYLPRVLSILIVCFFAMFILEGIGPDFGWQDSLMHALLTLIVLTVVIVSWKKPKIGGWFFIIFSIWYLWKIFDSQWWGGLFISGVFLTTGILFLIQGFKDKKAI